MNLGGKNYEKEDDIDDGWSAGSRYFGDRMRQ